MGLTEWVLVGLVLGAVAVVLLWRRAVRLDTLHRTVLRSRQTLETQLAQRAAAAHELATSGALDPAETLLVTDVVLRATDAAGSEVVPDGLAGSTPAHFLAAPDVSAATPPEERSDRALIESELSRTLRTVLGDGASRQGLAEDPRTGDMLDRLEQSWYRLQLARRFHNSHVEQVRRLRADPVVRYFRLAGRAPMPEPFDMDDTLPSD